MTNRIHLKKILWIYVLAFVLTAFSFNSKAQVLKAQDGITAPAETSDTATVSEIENQL